MSGRRVVLLGTSALASTLVSASALAQTDRVDPLATHHNYESPQHFALEIRIGLYKPDVDGDPALGGQKPYETVFGTSPLIYAGAELDFQALRIPHLGTLGPGFSAGFASASGQALFTEEHNGTFVSGETTTLDIFPLALVAVLRADALWREAGVPLVPYVKAGLGYGLWRASNTLGTSTFDGVTGTGGSLGTYLAGGVSFNLNVFDRYAAQNFDDAMGINATYLFLEWTWADLTGLGVQHDPLRVGSANWTFGLNFEF